MDEKKSGIVEDFRGLLKSEVAWILVIAGMLWGAVTTIVMPLQKLQIQVAQVQSDLQENKETYKVILDGHSNLDKRMSLLENKYNK